MLFSKKSLRSFDIFLGKPTFQPNLPLSNQSWIQALKPLCSSKQLLIQQPKPLAMLHSDRKSINQQSPNEFAVQIRTLYLTLFEARRLPVKIAPQPFFLICLNKNKIARVSLFWLLANAALGTNLISLLSLRPQSNVRQTRSMNKSSSWKTYRAT